MLEFIPGKEPFITHSCRGLSVGIETESNNPRERIMKKVLLTTTALVMTAGVAAAEVSFSGTAQVALTDDNGKAAIGGTAGKTAAITASTGYVLTTGFDFDVKMSAATDNGITMSTSFDMGAGHLVDYDDDDAIEAQSDALGAPELTIGFSGYTVSAQQDGVDNLYDSDLTGDDLGISGTFSGVSFGFTTDMERESSSYKLGYTMGDLTLTVVGTNDDDGKFVPAVAAIAADAHNAAVAAAPASGTGSDSATKMSLAYKMGDLTVTASTDDKGDADSENKVGFKYAMDAITLSYTAIDPSTANKDMGDEWDAKIAYSAGAMSASYAIDEADATTLIAEYGLGGGATAFVAMHDKAGTASDMNTMGINFKF